MKKGTNDVARLSIADRIHQSAFAVFYPWAARLESLMGRKSDAAVVAVWHAGGVLVVEHSYMRGLTLPGGHIRSNEIPVLAAARELEEEVGLVIAPAEIRFFGCMEQRHTRLSASLNAVAAGLTKPWPACNLASRSTIDPPCEVQEQASRLEQPCA